MVATLSMQSCREDSNLVNTTPPTPETTINVLGSVMGSVIDDNGQAVADADVRFNGLTTTTDEYGIFQFIDEQLHANGTYIKVEKDGYFLGSRKFYPAAGSTSRITVELMPMEEVVSFASSAGEKVQFEGVEIAFGNNSIMTEDGADYNGNVKVFAQYLDPTLNATFDQMPGDLTAMNAEDERVGLTTFGMVAVELRDDNGNELQVKTGMTVDITTPVPADLLASAPQTIPMWHFDEDQGTWVEEGEATLVNGSYETQLGHFSFWNYDVPSNFIHLSGSVFNRGVPVENVFIKITNTDNGSVGSGYTNNLGVFGGYVPNGAVLTLEVYDQCGTLIYTTTVGPFEEDVVLDPFNLNILVDQVTISGSVTSCDGEPSDATYVVVQQGELTSILSVEENNEFQGNIFYCNAESDLTVGAVDPINGLASANSTFTIDGEVDAGILELCEESLSSHLFFQFGNEEILIDNSNTGQDSTFIFTYSTQTINGTPDKVIYTITVLDWATLDVYNFNLIYVEGVPIQNVLIPIPSAGFEASGEATIMVVEQGGTEFITATGTLPVTNITDPSLYDPSYDPLYFHFALEL